MFEVADRSGTTLVLGYGNPARGDDGLGPALVARLQQAGLEQVEARVDYQLCVEDAMDIGSFKEVVFVDASKSVAAPYVYQPLAHDAYPATLDTHSVSPEALMHLARTLFGATTPAHLLAIRGYDFEPFIEKISEKASRNLEMAYCHILKCLNVI